MYLLRRSINGNLRVYKNNGLYEEYVKTVLFNEEKHKSFEEKILFEADNIKEVEDFASIEGLL